MALADRLAALREEADGRPLFDTARTLGDAAIAEPGCECWARVDGGDARMRFDGEPRGGIILEIVAGHPDVDEETGEVVHRRAYRLFDYDPRTPPHQRISVLTETQIDPQSFGPPNLARIRNLYRQLCRDISRRKGTATVAEIDMVHDAWRLAAIVGQQGAH
jgi:hypothetical protein